MKKSILVTGGAGFIGSNFIPYFMSKYSDYSIINLDKLTYAGDQKNLKEHSDDPRYKFIQGDICDRDLVEKIFHDHHLQGVIHFAAESHVDNSISGPSEFIRTNVVGTFTLLDVARKAWMKEPFQILPSFQSARFHHISTDEVYGSLGDTGYFTESTAYAPNSPYSASKASSDLIARSYFHTYGLNVVTTNCSNNYGPKQHEEKLIPTVIRKAIIGDKIPVYGDGKNIRDWLFVDDHCRGIDLAFHQGETGETYNIGGGNEKTNIEIVNIICSILDAKLPLPNKKSYSEQITYVTDRPGHDRRYAIDARKIENELGWKAEESFNTGIMKTVDWYISKVKKI
jgi:dTDP-glucose 4,6-dehydratase